MTQQAEPDAIPDDATTDGAPEESRGASRDAAREDGFGAAFCASMATLCVEAALAGTIAVLVLLSREHDGLPGNAFVIVAAVLVVALLTVLISGFVTAAAVMPTLALARRAARRAGRAEGPLWVLGAVPAVSAVAVAAFGGVAALGSLSLARPSAYLLWWAALTVALMPGALLARAAARRLRAGRSARTARRVARYGGLVWLVTAALGAGAYGTGLVSVYEPPRLEKSELAGMWSDGRGGKVELAPDGGATARGLDNFVWDGMGKDRPTDCDGSGTWTAVKDGGTVQGISLRIRSCELSREWSVSGTEKEPRIFHEIGKPGSGKRYVLKKVAPHDKGEK
ncbi:hypothetical protein AB8O64_15615 [Streptomyces sp. QH1-20]|uniref:hypothetical protein n=1 Tax=Streptomyces sp. QH1-20 TaxID=3240934 RepID=UPI0035124852